MVKKETVLLRQIPFFKHLMDDEISSLNAVARPHSVKKGSSMKSDTHSLYIIDSGVFTAKDYPDSIYAAQSSFFGKLPFCDTGYNAVKALTDATVLEFPDKEVYHFLCNNFKALRGFLRTADYHSLPLSDTGKKILKNKTKIITIFSDLKHCGKTMLAVACASACSLYGKTMLLDASYDGLAVFDMCGKKMLPPLSQKNPDDVAGQKFIEQRIEKVSETLDILNIAHGSKVKINPDILNPLLFYLSFDYSYIVIDCSHIDEKLRDVVLGNSDVIIEITNSKSIPNIQFINDTQLTQGQKTVYVVNRHFEKTAKIHFPHYDFDTIHVNANETVFKAMLKVEAHKDPLFINVLKNTTAVVLPSGMHQALYYAGLYEAMRNKRNIDIVYTAGFSFPLFFAFLKSQSHQEFKKIIHEHFSDDSLHSMFDVCFPDAFLFKNNPLRSLASDVCGCPRIEWNDIIPYAMLMSHSGTRLLSTGNSEDVIAASLAFQPLFQGMRMNNTEYYSPFPYYPVAPETLLRTHTNDIAYINIDAEGNPLSHKSKVLGLYRKYVDFLPYSYLYAVDNVSISRNQFTLAMPNVSSLRELIEKSFENEEAFDAIIASIGGG